MTSTSTATRGLAARDGLGMPVGSVLVAGVVVVPIVAASLLLALASRAEPLSVPATTWPVLAAMVTSVGLSIAAIRTLGRGWPDLRRLLTVLTAVAAAYPGLWALAVLTTARAPDSTAAWVTAVLAGLAHLPVIGAFSVVPLLGVRYLGPGSGRSLLTAVTVLGVAAAVSFALFFDDFDPLAASAPVPSDLGERVGMTLNLAYLTTVLLGPAVALRATWRSAADVAAARRLALVAGSSLAGTLLVMVCGALGGVSDLGGIVLLVGMYAALAVVVTGCVRSLATPVSAPTASAPIVSSRIVSAPAVSAPIVSAPEPTPTRDAPEAGLRGDTPAAGPDEVPARAGDESPPVGLTTLTRRENEVLQLLAEGLSNAGIAARLVLSERTVDAHLRSVFVKLDLPQGPEHNRRVQAVNALRSGHAGSLAEERRSVAS